MPEYIVKIRSVGLKDAINAVNGAKERMRDVSPALKKGVNVMLRSIDQNFKSAGRPTRWKPLSRRYAVFKAKKGFSPLPLTRSGALRRSIVSAAGFAGNNRLVIGTSIPYGAVHQYGGGNNIPKRRYLLFQKEDLRRIESLIVSYIVGRGFIRE